MRWAALIQRVYEVDPLKCPKCGGAMKIISFIEKHQADVIEKIDTSLPPLCVSPSRSTRLLNIAAYGSIHVTEVHLQRLLIISLILS